MVLGVAKGSDRARFPLLEAWGSPSGWDDGTVSGARGSAILGRKEVVVVGLVHGERGCAGCRWDESPPPYDRLIDVECLCGDWSRGGKCISSDWSAES